MAKPPLAGREYITLCDVLEDGWRKSGRQIRVSDPGWVKVLDVASGESIRIDIPFFGHSIVQNPAHPEQLVVFEKWGLRGAMVDVKEKALLATTESMEDNIFFGHLAFNSDASLLVATEANYRLGSDDGFLVIRDPSTLKVVTRHSSYGPIPHQCRTIDNGKTIVVLNQPVGLVPGNLAWIDFESGRLLNKIPLSLIMYGHFSISHDGWICVGGTLEKGQRDLIIFISPEGKIFPMSIPDTVVEQINGEALSIEYLNRGDLVGITLPSADLVLVMDYKKQTVLHSVQVKSPKGLLPGTADMGGLQNMIVSSYKDRNLLSIETTKDRPETTVIDSPFGGFASHITRFYI